MSFPAFRFLAALLLLLAASSCGEDEAHPDEAAVRVFLNRYFATWSAKDMDGYGACFHPAARVFFVEKSGELGSQGLTDFLHGQKMGHETSPVPMTEAPTDMKITLDARSAQAVVRWRLAKGAETVTGTDLFTLIKTQSGWQIASLVFYND